MKPRTFRVGVRTAFAALMLVLTSACSLGSGTASIPAGMPASANQSALRARALLDDWLTLGRNDTHDGLQTQNVGFSSSTVNKLALRWKQSTGEALYTGPLVFGGNVIIVSLGALNGHPTMYDFRATDGHLLWKLALEGEEVRAPPTIDPARNLVVVATRNWRADSGAYLALAGELYTIDIVTGHVKWMRKLPFPTTQPVSAGTHGSAVVEDGKIYIGTSGGDEPQCSNGGIEAYDESTGKHLWTWLVNPQNKPKGGGSVWGSIAYDGSHLLFGTGNTCGPTPVTTADGAVELTLGGKVVWSFVAHQESAWDDDTGGGVTLIDGKALFINKNGTFYQVNAATGQEQWARPLGASDGSGAFATAATDGSINVIGAGQFLSSNVAHRPRKPMNLDPRRGQPLAGSGTFSYVKAVDENGSILWKRYSPNFMTGEAAIASGVVFTGLGNAFAALNLRTGATLWHYQGAAPFDPAPAVVPSGVYTADDAGTVYAFSVPASDR